MLHLSVNSRNLLGICIQSGVFDIPWWVFLPHSFLVNLVYGWWASLVAQRLRISLPNAGDAGSSPGSGRSPEGGNGNPLQYSCQRNPMDRGAWRATVHGVVKSYTTERLNNNKMFMASSYFIGFLSGLHFVCLDDLDFLKYFWTFCLFSDSYLENCFSFNSAVYLNF